MNIFNNIGLGIAAVGTVIAGWFGYAPVENQVRFGASTQSSEVRALFTTTLASKITSSATSMTLSSATDKDGTVLASSTYGFIIDEGTSKEELVLADCTGTTCTNMTRGLSVRTGTTTVAALQFEHGRGAEVKITDAPALIYASNVFRGKQNLEYKLKYDSAQTFSDGNDIISRSYADSLAFGSVPAANETTSGFVELATGVETASSTSLGGTGARLAIPASLATSTYNSATAGLKVVVTQNDGKIDSNFLSNVAITTGNNTWTGVNTFSTTTATSTMVGSMPAYWIGKNVQVITTTGTSTFTVPSGVNKLKVEVVGGGGNGGGGSSSGATCGSGGGGGSGGYAIKYVDVSNITSFGVYVGAAGAYSQIGGTGVSYVKASAGSQGSDASGSGGSFAGGAGGVSTGGDINASGSGGNGGIGVSGAGVGGHGGASVYGGAGTGSLCNNGGGSAQGYGAGGGGGSSSSGTGNVSGGAGAQGIVIITW